MLALRKIGSNKGLSLCEIDVPKPSEEEVLVKITSSSICGSDLYVYNWESWAPHRCRLPLTLGHELAGTVVDKGSAVTGYSTGDKVAIESHIYCGSCYNCREDKKHVCDNLKIIGIDTDGGFASYIKIPAKCCWKLPEQIDIRQASLMEPFGNAVHVLEDLKVPGKSALVLGCGPIGIFTVQLLKYFNASVIWAVEPSEFRLSKASEAGSTRTINPAHENLRDLALRNSITFDYVFEMSGNKNALKDALKLVKSGGTVTTFGLQKSDVDIDVTSDIIMREVNLRGIVGRHLYKTWDLMTKILCSGKIDLNKVITHKISIKDYDDGFKLVMSDDKLALKVVMYLD